MRRFLIAILLILSAGMAHAQSAKDTIPDSVAYMVNLKEYKITAPWKNDTDRYHYNQTKYYVTVILPYLDAAAKLFKDVNAKANQPGISRKDRRKYINSREDEIRDQFESKVKKLNTTQGVLLVKLIARQTEVNIYEILQEFKNPLTAVKWQMWARMNGMNLDKRYDPEQEPTLELIMDELGYPLPPSYALNSSAKH